MRLYRCSASFVAGIASEEFAACSCAVPSPRRSTPAELLNDLLTSAPDETGTGGAAGKSMVLVDGEELSFLDSDGLLFSREPNFLDGCTVGESPLFLCPLDAALDALRRSVEKKVAGLSLSSPVPLVS